jgi:hypothetical protein
MGMAYLMRKSDQIFALFWEKLCEYSEKRWNRTNALFFTSPSRADIETARCEADDACSALSSAVLFRRSPKRTPLEHY